MFNKTNYLSSRLCKRFSLLQDHKFREIIFVLQEQIKPCRPKNSVNILKTELDLQEDKEIYNKGFITSTNPYCTT